MNDRKIREKKIGEKNMKFQISDFKSQISDSLSFCSPYFCQKSCFLWCGAGPARRGFLPARQFVLAFPAAAITLARRGRPIKPQIQRQQGAA
jgi:hypothetical protein